MRNVRDGKDWGSGENSFEGIKRSLVDRGPNPRNIFLSEGSERGNDVRIIRDKLPLEVCKAKERKNAFD